MPSTNWQERPEPDEPQRFERYAEQLRELQRRNARGKPPSRALHAKGQLGAEARFEVLAGAPEHARTGIFAAAGNYRAYVRFSNGSGMRQHDAKADVRGVAIKLLGVPGKKLIPGMENAKTQDFLLIRSPSTPFRTADEFVPFVMAVTSPLTGFPKVIAKLGIGRTLQILKRAGKELAHPMGPVAATRYFSATPVQFGKYAACWSLKPHAQPPTTPLPKSAEWLAQEMTARLKAEPVEYDFQAQFFEDEARTPIEDASRDWDAPWVTLARLTLPRQDVDSERGRRVAQLIEGFSFDPWHAPVEFRPLGNVMRARNHAYRLSTIERKASPEPDGSELTPSA